MQRKPKTAKCATCGERLIKYGGCYYHASGVVRCPKS